MLGGLIDHELIVRALWGIIVVGLVVVSILSNWSYGLLTFFIGLMSVLELANMFRVDYMHAIIIYVVDYVATVFFGFGIGLALGLILVILSSLRLNPLESTDKRWILVKVVSVYVALCTSSFIMFKLYVPSPWIVLCFWLSLWVFDSTAYLWGRNTGSERFAPFISPGKNLEGFVFGYITTILCSALLSVIFKQPIINMFGIFVPLSGICGDLLESWAKRIAGVKDSGKIIPYHGGIWDRFDSSLLASLVVLVVIECL